MYPSVFILIFALAVKNVFPYSAEYTVTIEPGKEDCFYTTVSLNSYLEVDYQVSVISLMTLIRLSCRCKFRTISNDFRV